MNPPRALWVPFILGRPLGVPGDAAFQRRVMVAALGLFNRERGPVLEDYREEAPAVAADAGETLACPVTFARERKEATAAERVMDEIAGLKMWHDIAVRRNGRTSTGIAGAPLDTLVTFIAAWAQGEARPSYRDGLPNGDALRLACEEVKAFYFEALGAQPGAPDAETLRVWFWEQTAAGSLLLDLRRGTENASDASVAQFAVESLIPRSVWHTIGKRRAAQAG